MIHLVQQGECLSSIASRYGLTSWHDLYDLPDNAELKELGRHPNILAPGDEVTVPAPPTRWEKRPTEKRHRFVVPTGTVKLRIFVRSPAGEGYEGKRFVLEIGDRVIEGTSKAKGLVEADVPAGARQGRLQMWILDDPDDPGAQIDRTLAIGHLDPVEMISGVQARLQNLGYPCAVTGEVEELTLDAVRAFRKKNGLPEVPCEGDDAGDDPAAALIDDTLRAKLRAAHEGG